MAETFPAKSAALTAAPSGDSGSAAALGRLSLHLADVREKALQPLLHSALSALRAGRRDAAAQAALKALDIDEGCGLAWHILAICREKSGDFTHSLQAYDQALRLMPDEPEIANDLGRLALKMGMAQIAAGLFAQYLVRRPGSIEGLNNLACAQRDLMDFAGAIETLRAGLGDHPGAAMLWNALGSVLTLQGQMEQALIFYDEALRLDPGSGQAHYNRSIARLAEGDAPGAIADLDAAADLMTLPGEVAALKVARAKALLASGSVGEGWDAYEARHDPAYADAVQFPIGLPEGAAQMDVAAKHLLVIGEQGLGDEILFAHALPDLIADVGPLGRVTAAVDPRLVSLFARSFPEAEIGAHASGRIGHLAMRSAPFVEDRLGAFDAALPMGALMRRYRRRPEAFPAKPFLSPDPARVDHWRKALAALACPAVGVLWKSLVMDADRMRQFAPFAEWAPVLTTPGVTFVNLQYGQSEAEAEAAQRLWGTRLWTPPGLDLKDDLDDLAALTCALDLTVGPANATTNLAGACGAPVWLISTPGAWPRLGRADYPWYPQARVFTPQAYGLWGPVMGEIGAALRRRFPI